MESWRAELYHHGILGQKWGQRNGPPYPLKAGDHSAREKKAGWRKSLDNAGVVLRKKKTQVVERFKKIYSKPSGESRAAEKKPEKKDTKISDADKRKQLIKKVAVGAAVAAAITAVGVVAVNDPRVRVMIAEGKKAMKPIISDQRKMVDTAIKDAKHLAGDFVNKRGQFSKDEFTRAEAKFSRANELKERKFFREQELKERKADNWKYSDFIKESEKRKPMSKMSAEEREFEKGWREAMRDADQAEFRRKVADERSRMNQNKHIKKEEHEFFKKQERARRKRQIEEVKKKAKSQWVAMNLTAQLMGRKLSQTGESFGSLKLGADGSVYTIANGRKIILDVSTAGKEFVKRVSRFPLAA